MAGGFRMALTAVPGVSIRVGRQGLSTTVAWDNREPARGGPWGMSKGSSSGASLSSVGDGRFSGPLPTDPHLTPGTRVTFGSGNVSQMTSPGLDSFKSLLVATRQRQQEIRSDVTKARLQLGLA